MHGVKALVGYFFTSYPTRAHGIIVIYHQPNTFLFLFSPELLDIGIAFQRALLKVVLCRHLKQRLLYAF